MNRGSIDGTRDGEQPLVPSMRPRFMNRGSFHAVRVRDAPRRPFNEAPIHESGK